jgi:putative membrane protein
VINLVLYFVVMAGSMLLLTQVLPGFVVTGWGPALWAAFWLGLLNTLLKPVLFLLTLPLTILTLGLFLLVLNGLMLWIASRLVEGFSIPGGFGTTILASIVLSLVGMVWKGLSRSH